jgi:hypothetical protein
MISVTATAYSASLPKQIRRPSSLRTTDTTLARLATTAPTATNSYKLHLDVPQGGAVVKAQLRRRPR